MLHKHITMVGLALALLGLASTVAFAQDNGGAVSTGAVATITAIDANTNVAILQTNAGEVFELAQRPSWHVGHQVLCDRIGGERWPRLQNCRLWEEGHAEGQSPAPRAGRFTATESLSATPMGRFNPGD